MNRASGKKEDREAPGLAQDQYRKILLDLPPQNAGYKTDSSECAMYLEMSGYFTFTIS